jgi:RNA polymerase sigma factor (sigma-70 family)
MTVDQDRRISEVVLREQSRLRSFIRRRVADRADAEDILQDVFFELVEANRRLMPIDHITGWLFRVARNRITDLFRSRRSGAMRRVEMREDQDAPRLDEVLPSPDAGPDDEYVRVKLLEALEQAVAELPPEQRDVFIAHELEGRSFKDLAATTGVGVNTLLARKRYAVRRLRERLRRIHDELTRV